MAVSGDDEARRILDEWGRHAFAGQNNFHTVGAYARRLEADVDRLRTERTECEADLNAARARIAALEAEYATVNNEAVRRVEVMDARIAAARTHIERARTDVHMAGETRSDLTTALAALDGEAGA